MWVLQQGAAGSWVVVAWSISSLLLFFADICITNLTTHKTNTTYPRAHLPSNQPTHRPVQRLLQPVPQYSSSRCFGSNRFFLYDTINMISFFMILRHASGPRNRRVILNLVLEPLSRPFLIVFFVMILFRKSIFRRAGHWLTPQISAVYRPSEENSVERSDARCAYLARWR